MSGIPFFVGLARTLSGTNRRTPDQPPPTDPAVYSAPSAPSFLEQWGYTDVGVYLRWVPSTATDALTILGYKIYKDGTNLLATVTNLLVGDDGTIGYSLFGLNASTEYILTVKGYTAQYDSAASNTLTFTTAAAQVIDLTPPGAPQGVVVANLGNNGFTVSWTASTAPDISNYLVWADNVGPKLVLHPTVSTTFTGYAPSTTVNFRVYAMDTSGNQSGPSIVTPGTTPAPVNYNRTLAGALRTTAPTIFGTINTATVPPTGVVVGVPTGTLSHGSTVTVNGSGFGAKSPAAPVIWDNCSGTNPLTLWTGTWAGGTFNEGYRSAATVGRGNNPAHAHVTKMMCAACDPGKPDIMFWKSVNVSSGYAYVSFYERFDPLWPSFGDNNNKMYAYSTDNGTSPPYLTLGNYWYMGHHNEGTVPMIYKPKWGGPADGGACGSNPNGGIYTTVDCRTWHKAEYTSKFSAVDGGGYVDYHQDGVRYQHATAYNDHWAGAARSIGVGGYHRAYGSASYANTWIYYNDIYVDTTLSRVMLGNAATYAACTIREPQPPTSWSTTAIVVTLNHGALSTGTAYLYVIDSTGAINPNGRAVTLV